MSELSNMPNLGKVLVKNLEAVEIKSPQELIDVGAENAFSRIKALKDSGACLNMLYALEGAIQGIRWHGLPKERKEELRSFYTQM